MSDTVRISAYLLLAFVSIARARRGVSIETRIVLGIGVLASFLAVAIAISAAGMLADVGRTAARSEGWYQERRSVQAAAVLLLGISALGAAGWIWVGLRASSILSRALLSGAACLLAFLAVRTISLHQLDALLLPDTGLGIRRGDFVEVGFILLLTVLAAAVRGESVNVRSRPAATVPSD